MRELGASVRNVSKNAIDIANNFANSTINKGVQTTSDMVGKLANRVVPKENNQQPKEGSNMANDLVGQIAGLVNPRLINNTSQLPIEQTNNARNENQSFTAGKTAEQLQLEARMKREEADFLEAQSRRNALFTVDQGNRVSNANTARDMAFDTTQNLNRMYATAGDRLNNAAQTTQNNLQAAANTIASMFR